MLLSQVENLNLRKIYNPEGSDLRMAQLRMLTLLSFLDKVCKEHNLKYWLDSGTLIGAARHDGFIPWDDDVDICMPRNDAEKLKKILGNTVHERHIILQTQASDPNYINSSWMTLRDTKSEYLQDSRLHKRLKYRGLQVDIFIVDEGVSPFLKKIFGLFHRYFVWGPLLTNRFHRHLSKLTNFFNKLEERVIYPSLRKIKFNSILDVGYGAIYSNPQPKNVIYPLRTITFENKQFYCPNNVERYLTSFYGDWKSVPSKEKVVTHGVKFKFLD